MAKKKRDPPPPPSTAWMGTYGDMITLMLCFFVALFNPDESDPAAAAAIAAAFQSPSITGGQSLSSGTLADMGNTINSLPSLLKGSMLGPNARRAVSVFSPDVRNNKVSITSDERAITISLAGDNFFAPGSADLKINETRDTLMRLSQFLSSPELKAEKKRFRIEGHTDNSPVESGEWPSNWELSAARAINVLHYLADYGVDEKDFSVSGYADTRPKFPNDSAESLAYNRRVDIVILDDGYF